MTRSQASADAAGHETGSRCGVRLSPEQWDHWFQTGWPTVVSHKEAQLFYDHAAPRPGMSAVDLACGNGQWARQLAAWGLNATGFDFSAEALRQATAAGAADEPGCECGQ